MKVAETTLQDLLQELLEKRKTESLFRSLQLNEGLIDFCSNDYLSFARSEKIKKFVEKAIAHSLPLLGSTGSRLISGNSSQAEKLEQQVASFHRAESALLFNSGYDANVGLFSSIATKNDFIICDELIHASIIDGCRLSYATRFKFLHNDISHLERKIQTARSKAIKGEANIFVGVESVYSMDGDAAPLKDIALICKRYNANLIVDEAHATGVVGFQGRGLVNELNLEEDIFARVHTFSKALGCHGAAVVGSRILRDYLINFARSFIFTSALPLHTLICVHGAYHQLMDKDFDNSYLHLLIRYFKNDFILPDGVSLIESISPIQSLIIPGNLWAKDVSKQLASKGFDVRAILSPSVPEGRERLRICLHSHNSKEQVDLLKVALREILFA